MSSSKVRTFVEMESHPIHMAPWEMNRPVDPQQQQQSSMQVDVKTGKRQRTDAGISNIGVRIQQAMLQARALHNSSSSSSQRAMTRRPHGPVVVSPIPPPAPQMNLQEMDLPMPMDLSSSTLEGGEEKKPRGVWVCDVCGSTMDGGEIKVHSHSMGCVHEESSLRCVSRDY